MSFVFSAFVPHDPRLLPSHPEHNTDTFKKTLQALKDIEGEMYAMQPDVLLLISHAKDSKKNIGLNLSPNIKSEKYFGGENNRKFFPDVEFLSHLRMRIHNKGLNISSFSEQEIGQEFIVPLFYFTQHAHKARVVLVFTGSEDFETHRLLGKILRDEALVTNKRVAIVAAGDLAMTTSFSGKACDEMILKMMKKNSLSDILRLHPDLIAGSNECGLKSLSVLAGVLEDVQCHANILSYEALYGKGQLVAHFELL